MGLLGRQPSEDARSYALHVLLYNIITFELTPGNAVGENEFSLLLKLSRTPVQEALIELSKMGLMDIQPQRDSYIAEIDYKLIGESRFVHLVLENAVLRLVYGGISQEYETLLKANLEDEIQYLNTADYTRLFKLDTDFHKLLFLSVDEGRTYEVIRSQMVHFDQLRTLSPKSLKPDRIVEDHEDILYAIGRRDSELAEILMTRHLTRHRVGKPELVKRYPGYFA